MKSSGEWFEVVDACGRVLGLASREECHRNRHLRHRVAHVLVSDGGEQLYLQKRAAHKDIQPGKWDTSVGGHLRPGEDPAQGALRELAEELGISTAGPLQHVYQYEMRSAVETELVDTYALVWDGPIQPDPGEIEAGAWWTLRQIAQQLGQGLFTPNFEDEFRRWQKYCQDRQK